MDDDWVLLERCHTVLVTCRDDALTTGPTAARLFGLWLPDLPDDVHVATATDGAAARAMLRSRRGDVVAHRRQLTDMDRDVVHGVAVTSLPRTWFDLAPMLSLPALVAAGDRALQVGATPEQLREVVRRCGRARGVRRARVALTLLDARSRSRPESHLRVAVSEPDLPRFEVNEPVHRTEGGWLAEPDLSLAAARIALEYQGADHASVDRMRRDITRMADLRGEGWLCLLYGPAEVFGRPWCIAPELRRVIRERCPELLAPRRRARVVGQPRRWSPDR